MKKSLIIFLGGILFATLFHQQHWGLNALLYSIWLAVTLAILNPGSFKKPAVSLSALSMLGSSTAICYHGSGLSKTTFILSCLLFIGFVAQGRSSVYVAWVNGLYNFVFGVFHGVIHYDPKAPKKEKGQSAPTGQIIKIVIITLILVVLFTLLYSGSNPIIEQMLANLDFSFIDVFWVFLSTLGALIMANIAQPNSIEHMTNADLAHGNLLHPQAMSDADQISAKNETQIGTVAIGALDLLLILVLVTEVIFLTSLTDYPASALSDAVHSGVYASIASIILAIMIIAFVFRGRVNFIKSNTRLRQLTYLWIFLNLLLTASIFLKNFAYINDYGLTHKRLGVMLYLMLVVIGLVTTYLKVSYRLNFTYLIRRNVLLGYSVIAIYATINWSAIISQDQINTGKPDKKYLAKLMPQNILVLEENGLLEEIQEQETEPYKTIYRLKSAKFMKERNWQEFNYTLYRFHELTND
ncbi:DUF4153 domain-containing protein [Nonlabens xiamenensis]|uniref:DUF4153 domain-containing protein n=1 Tax=Nonlabens xiamenensis TaxID=2341043 RepID=UPI000F60C7B6|nr:DUF4153 domain-containing protein [Nonlabens xiamenensis]